MGILHFLSGTSVVIHICDIEFKWMNPSLLPSRIGLARYYGSQMQPPRISAPDLGAFHELVYLMITIGSVCCNKKQKQSYYGSLLLRGISTIELKIWGTIAI